MITFPSPLELAELIEPRIHLNKLEWDKLVAGVRTEQQRLDSRPFLTILWLKLLDLDGYDGYLQFGESFEDRDQAKAFVVAELADLLAAHTGPSRRRPWREDPDRACAAEGAASGASIQVDYGQTLSLTADDYINRIYFRAQVLGPFPGAVVGRELVAMLAGRYELSSYLRDVGKATMWSGPRRTPLTITRG
jgi:hypothetical protein